MGPSIAALLWVAAAAVASSIRGSAISDGGVVRVHDPSRPVRFAGSSEEELGLFATHAGIPVSVAPRRRATRGGHTGATTM